MSVTTPGTTEPIRIICVPNERIPDLADALTGRWCDPDTFVGYGHQQRAPSGRFQSATVHEERVVIHLVERHSKVQWSGGRRERAWFDVDNHLALPVSRPPAFTACTSFHLPESVAERVLADLENDTDFGGDAA